MAQVAADVDAYPVRLKRLTLTWVLVALVLFPVLAVLGFVMRVVQAGYFPALPPEWFYAVMTLHGLGIFHFRQIAAFTPDNVAWINRHLRFKGRIEREHWIEQARALAAGETPERT